MNRRKFLLASGSTILTGTSLGSFQQPAIGLEFELSAVPNEKPANIDSILVEFTNFGITPSYLDESNGLDITVVLDIEGESSVTKSVSGFGFTNGQTINQPKIQDQTGKDLLQVAMDGLNNSESNLRGDVYVRVNHSDISQKSYHRSFEINQTNIIDDFEDGTISPYNIVDSGTSSTIRAQTGTVYDGQYALEMSDSTGTPAISSTTGLSNYPKAGDKFRFFWRYNGQYAAGMNIFAAQSKSDFADGYLVRSTQSNTYEIQLLGNNGYTIADEPFDRSLYVDEWLETVIDWETDGAISIKLYDSNRNMILSLSGTDSTYTTGGINWQKGSGNTNTESVFFDNAEII